MGAGQGWASKAHLPALRAPPRVDYELTDLGRSIREPINALGDWAQAHESDIRAARRAFDASDDVQ